MNPRSLAESASCTATHSCLAAPRRASLIAPQSRRCSTVVRAKEGIHPKYYEEATVVCNGEEVLVTSGTQPKYTVDVWSGNHPFYTKSESTMVKDEGRVSRFNKRFGGLAMGTVAASKPGDKRLDYKPKGKDKGKKGKGKK